MITLTQEVFNSRFGNLNAAKQEGCKWIVSNTSKLPALIDFNAEWCSPCKTMHPVLEKLVKSPDQIQVVWRIPYFTDAMIQSASVTAVIKTAPVETVSYWALKHAGEKPDFHLRGSFIHRFF